MPANISKIYNQIIMPQWKYDGRREHGIQWVAKDRKPSQGNGN